MVTITRPCGYPGCPELVSHRERCCPEHQHRTRRYDQERGTSSERGYGSRWRAIRRQVLIDEPLCRDCMEKGRVMAANEVHHKDGNPRNNARENLCPLCKPCHNRRTATEQGFAKRL